MTGQNLIRAAELRSVTTEFQSYQTAVNTFKDKYFALPGDFKMATDFWTASTSDVILGQNAPRSKLSNAGWTARHCVAGGCGGADYTIDYNNRLTFGAESTSWDTDAAAIIPEEAWNIDTKIDDGKPAYGKVIALFYNNQCSAADDGSHQATDLAASYKLSNTSVACALVFRNAF